MKGMIKPSIHIQIRLVPNLIHLKSNIIKILNSKTFDSFSLSALNFLYQSSKERVLIGRQYSQMKTIEI